MTKNYRSVSFVRKIEMNLANVSVKPTDEFTLVKAYYDIDGFDCELCGHKDCAYAFEVMNLQTKEVIKVGSECITHFEGRGVDIDLAEGLMQRVTAASNKARRDLKRRLGTDAWNALPLEDRKKVRSWEQREFIDKLGAEEYKKISKEEKRELIVTEFLTLQTKELLVGVSTAKSILTEEDVKVILELGLEEEMNRALKQRELWEKRKAVQDAINAFNKCLAAPDFDAQEAETLLSKIAELDPNINTRWSRESIRQRVEKDERVKALRDKYGWLIDYNGNNWQVRRIRDNLINWNSISSNDESTAHSLIDSEAQHA